VLRLGIDTSQAVGVGLAWPGGQRGLREDDTRSHVERLAGLIRDVFQADPEGRALADVDEIAVGVGPGPFTGLRVGVAAALALGEALGVPVRGVCSLDVVACQLLDANPGGVAPLDGGFVVASDARRKELYWALYRPDGQRREGPFVTPPDQLPVLPTCGPAASLYPLAGEIVAADATAQVDAAVMAAQADALPDAGLDPLYLRRPDAQVPTRRKSVLTFGRLT
jgi:tRNA threonylcarbamoyl adenosine modification protein YeaZ